MTPKQIKLNRESMELVGAVKLTTKQKQVIRDLQGGSILITDSEMTGADVAAPSGVYHITNRVFWKLVDLDLIFQNPRERHYYTLTILGKNLKID